jgi:MFS family permease
METQLAKSRTGLSTMPRGIWALGLVSLFMDISSEMIHGLLPVFLTSVLGVGAEIVGLIEGTAEATAAIGKLFSGWLSDRIGKRKALTVIGYGLSAFCKPLFAIATTPAFVLVARFSDRVGKGVRDAPRDALVSDLIAQGQRGGAYGLRQSLDTMGAVIGPLLAIGLMEMMHDNFRMVFWLAVIPALIAVLILVVGVHEPPRRTKNAAYRIQFQDLRAIGPTYWIIVGAGAMLTLARFSEAFLVLRAQHSGLSFALVPLVCVVMSTVYAAAAYPFGELSDRIDRKIMLELGFAVLMVADLVLALAADLTMVMIGIGLWGLHMAATQGLLSALVADSAPQHLRATAFGFFNAISGIAVLLASLIAGLLWEKIGPHATFFAGSVFTALGLLVLFITARGQPGALGKLF